MSDRARLSARDLVLLAVLGALLGPLFDQIHVVGGALHYPAPDLLGQPWWVYPQFSLASLAMAGTCQWFLRLQRAGDSAGSIMDVERSLVWFVGAYLSSVVFQSFEWGLAVALVVLFAWRLRDEAHRLPLVLYAVACSFGGTLWEVTISSQGFFTYDAPAALISVPAWLPGLYLHAALFTRASSRLLAVRAAPAPSEA